MFFKRKKRLEVDAGTLEKDEEESLAEFLRSNLKTNVTLSGNKVSVDSERLTLEDLKRSVNKFVYHRNLNRKYWIALNGNAVKINRFEKAKKPEKRKKEMTPPSTIKHGW